MDFILEFDEWEEVQNSGTLNEWRTKGALNLTDKERKEKEHAMGIAGFGGSLGGAIGSGTGSYRKKYRTLGAGAGAGIGARIGYKGAGKYAAGGAMIGGITGRALSGSKSNANFGHLLGSSIGGGMGGAYGAHHTYMKNRTAKLRKHHPHMSESFTDDEEFLLHEDVFDDYLVLEAEDIFNEIQSENTYTEDELTEILNVLEEELLESQSKYHEFFRHKLEQHGVKSPKELDTAGRSRFFTEVKHEWRKASSIKECLYLTNDEFITLAENLTDDDVEYLVNIDEEERVNILSDFLEKKNLK